MAFRPDRESFPTVFSGSLAYALLAASGLFFLCVWLLIAPVPTYALDTPTGNTTDADSEASDANLAAMTDTLMVSARALTDAVSPSAAGMVTVVDLGRQAEGRDLAEILGSSAGFQVRRYGGLGYVAVPSLRGSSAAQIRIFVDGLPLNDAQSGSVDLSQLPSARFERAEIHRGLVPAGMGGAGGAGAVNLVTRDFSEGFSSEAFTGGMGARGGRLSWGVSNAEGDRSLLLMLHGRRADNEYEYLDNHQTYHVAEDDSLRIRKNAWFEEWGVWGRGFLPLGPATLKLTAGWFRKDGGRPGPTAALSPHATVASDRLDAGLRLELPWDLSLESAAARREQILYDPEREIDDGFGGDIRSVGQDMVMRLAWTPTWQRDADGGWLPTSLGLTTGVENRLQDYRLWYGSAQDPRRNRRTTSLFTGAPLSWAAGRLQVTPAWRYQFLRDDFPPLPALPWLPEEVGVRHDRHDVSPSLGVLFAVVPEKVVLEAHVGQSVRVPTWIELFGHRAGIDGNRDLQPEEINSADVAVFWAINHHMSARLTAFFLETAETIIFIQNSPGTSKARNIGASRNRGVELEGRANLPLDLVLTGNFTWQDPEDRGIQAHAFGHRLPYLSATELDVRLALRRGVWRPWLEIAARGEFYRDRISSELIRAPARAMLNLGCSRRLNDNLTLSAEVINLTDDRTYDIVRFPLPGRTWQMALRWHPQEGARP